MNMKKFMLIVAAGLALVACNTEKKDATATTEDSTAIVAEAPVVAEPEVFNYATADGKQHFELTVTGENRETATLKDVEGNVVYDMKNAESADGVKWTSEDGHSFWTKGDTFTFFEGDKQLCEGALVVEAPATEAPAAE
ncbi:hypothetical protein PORUE0001_1533 [Porphyromonas uenonis 60-3]|jgi:hypothetical protein|uniref:C-type lysozyme inhibitor domain-containing protein n=2 Tax=Porphyromonas uenonis TaxID=281920 RepID=C2M9D8_9PORP|nr:hypothetical protein PORUE0001_1533 [Porphyromonas uenonis 60-3]CQB89149.1 Membrane-bound lysozyme-inhibitor of c-type lysozyme [Chlamydia trachomatis]